MSDNMRVPIGLGEYLNHTVELGETEPIRADRYVSEYLKVCSRSQLQSRIASFAVNGLESRLSRRLKNGDVIQLRLEPEPRSDLVPEQMDLSIIFENEDVLVLNKPSGLVVHPGAGNWTGTLVHGLVHRYSDIAGRFEEALRPGIVHRLDKDTSGVLIVAKSTSALASLQKQFQKRETEKIYLAIVRGSPRTESGTVDLAIARDLNQRKRFIVDPERGRPARTEYRVIRRFGDWSFLAVRPVTGRTHQIRVHLQSLGLPVAGDPVYRRVPTNSEIETRLMLHAYRLSITLPGQDRQREFRAPIDPVMRKALSILHDLNRANPG